MAMVLEAFSSYLLNMVAEMTKEEIKTLFGASSGMDNMRVKLGDLKRFLVDADRRNITDETVQEWVRELKGAMYDATDIVDLCKLKTAKWGNCLDAGCLNPLLFCMRNPLFTHEIGCRMKKLNQKLDDINERRSTFNIKDLGPQEHHGGNNRTLSNLNRETSGELNKFALVGEKIEEDTRILVEMLTNKEDARENSKIMVFAVVGVGGIGKTTLAKMIFSDEKINEEFDTKLWLSVNQGFSKIELLRKAVAEAKGDHTLLTVASLEKELKEALKKQKTMLVMDDVWDPKAWVDVLETPLTNALGPGSRVCVLVTTRNEHVALGMKAVKPYHHVNKLEPKDAWSLLKKQYISLGHCKNLRELPDTITKLQNLRHLSLNGTNIKSVPKGFGSLTNLRALGGFPTCMDGNWCSLEELGKLSYLITLDIRGIYNISSSLFAQKARLGEKAHLRHLALYCTNGTGDDALFVIDAEDISDKRQKGIEAVFDELCPPPCLEYLEFNGYFGWRLPKWMMLTLGAPLGSLSILVIKDLPFCTELPDCLYQLPCLELLRIVKVPLIKSVGPKFLQSHNHGHPRTLENLGSAVFKVEVGECLGLERISNLPKTQELRIIFCPMLKVLEGMSALRRLSLEDYEMKALPGYLQDVNPMYLHVDCDVSLLTSMAAGKSGPEWDKFSHIKQVKAYADDAENDIERKWHVAYTRDPFSFKTNIDLPTSAQGMDIEEEQ